MTRISAFLLLALAVTAHAPQAALAQAGADENGGGSYRELVKEAVREFDAANWPEALGLFKRAHELEPNSRTLRGMGMASYEMRDYVQAIGYLQTALGDKRRPLTASQRKEAERIIAHAQNFVARYRIDVDPQRATVLVDGKEVAHGDAHEVVLNSGMREIVVEADGFEALRRMINAEPGESREIRLVLSPAPAPEPEPIAAPAPLPAEDTAATTAPDEVTEPDHTWVWVTGASAVAFAGAGVAFYLLADGEYEDIDGSCRADDCTAAETRQRIADSPGETYDTLTVASFIASGVAAAAAVTIFLIEDGGSSEQPALGLTITPGGVGMRGSF